MEGLEELSGDATANIRRRKGEKGCESKHIDGVNAFSSSCPPARLFSINMRSKLGIFTRYNCVWKIQYLMLSPLGICILDFKMADG
jgi:hypothetical protein